MAKGITVNKDADGNVREARYLTDDRDARDGRRLELCIGWGNNGDWYVITVPEGERGISAVRLCTSGGASSAVPGFVPLIAEVFRKLVAAAGEPVETCITAPSSDSIRRAAEEIVPDCLSRICFIKDCSYDECRGCDDSKAERKRVAGIISRHCGARSGGGK